MSGLPLVETVAAQEIVHVAARLGDQQDPGETIPRIDMMLDKAVAPAGGDISERERAGAGPRRRGARRGDPSRGRRTARGPQRMFQPTSIAELASALAR